MNAPQKVTAEHLRRQAFLYIRQSTLWQVHENRESTARQYDLKRRAQALGWSNDQIIVIDDDLGLSGASASHRNGFQRLVAEVGLGRVGIVMGLEVSRLARSSTDWHRLFGGQLNKARRGELKMRPPIGYVYDSGGRVVFDPDEQVQRAVQLLFETFRRTDSALRVVHHFKQEGILWPRRITSGVRAGELLFAPLEHSRVLGILHNPRYTGAFVYGRTRQRKVVIADQLRYRRLNREEWAVFLPNMYPGYISWEEFEANQAKLLANANGYGEDRRRSPAREGTALLQGLVICGVCGLRMTVRCHTDHGLRRAQVQRVREEAELAQRQYMLARPENRLVVDNLERQRNEKLTQLAQAEEEYARLSKAQAAVLTPEDRDRIHTLVSDLPRVWNDARSPARDRKRMLRLLIEDVTLIKKQNIELHIR
jgi:DNA invertase Pin-like site-specific DNA recombinase